MLKDLNIQPIVFLCLPIFFLLGYLLYSTMYAAVGAMVNSEEEAQQLQWPVMMPLILCSVFASAIIRDPNSPLAFWSSMLPADRPHPYVRAHRRISPGRPSWQIVISIAPPNSRHLGHGLGLRANLSHRHPHVRQASNAAGNHEVDQVRVK